MVHLRSVPTIFWIVKRVFEPLEMFRCDGGRCGMWTATSSSNPPSSSQLYSNRTAASWMPDDFGCLSVSTCNDQPAMINRGTSALSTVLLVDSLCVRNQQPDRLEPSLHGCIFQQQQITSPSSLLRAFSVHASRHAATGLSIFVILLLVRC